MRRAGADVRHQRILMIAVARGGDAELCPGPGRRPVGGDHEPCAELASVRERQAHAAPVRLDGLHRRLDEHRAGRRRRLGGAVLEAPAVDDAAEIRLADLGAIEGE